MINLMIVEDNDVVRGGLIRFFRLVEDFNVVANAADAATALTLLKDLDVDLVMADWNMPDMDGLQLTEHILKHYPLIKVAILTMHGKPEYREKAKAAGAKGYLLKDGEFEDLVIALQDITAGKPVFQ